MELESNKIKEVVENFKKNHEIVKGKLDEYSYSYYKQLLFVAATLLGILNAINPKDNHLSGIGIYSILLAQVMLATSCLAILLLLRAQVKLLRKFRNEVVQYYINLLKNPFRPSTLVTVKEPFYFSVL